jgi:16S rRNA (cytosine967-C5)-methyltransferase
MTRSGSEARVEARARDAQVGLPARRAAAELLAAVLQKKQPLDDILGRSLERGAMFDLPARDRALTRAIVAASLRRKGQLDHVLGTFLARGMPEKSGTLYPILLSAAAQLVVLDTPPHAAIDLAVTLAQYDPRASRYAKLANAVLRRVAGEGAAIAAGLDAARINTPDWLWSRWITYWGEERARRIGEAHLIEPPLDLTVKADPALWAERLSGRVLPGGSVRLLPKGRIEDLPGFKEGAWWVQDVGASLPARLLRDVEGKHVADLCAAPGGKTAQLALAGASVVAVDSSKTRVSRLRENLDRLGLQAETVVADAATWQPDESFDAVLLDAPCSSTGTIRRHPDIPYVKSAQDITALAALQARLLDNAARIVRPGGRIVFSTCSLEPEEGEAQIAALLARNEALSLEAVEDTELFGEAAWIAPSGCLRTFPFQLALDTPEWSGMDGFFAARLVRAT